MKALDLAEWGLAAAEAAVSEALARVRLHLVYPDYSLVMTYRPAERRQHIAAILRQELRILKTLLLGVPVTRIGTAHRPAGLIAQLPLSRLPSLLAAQVVASISIEEIAGRVRTPPPAKPTFWSIKARFVVQVEQANGGLQTFEDRILVVKAFDEADAQRRLLPTFEDYAEPYLNSAGYLVRWQFEQFLDAYEVVVALPNELLPEGYLEVFSNMGRRKLTPDREWHPTAYSTHN